MNQVVEKAAAASAYKARDVVNAPAIKQRIKDAMVVERVFSQLNFERPLLLIESPDTSGRLFVVEQRGRIKTFVKGANPAPGSYVLETLTTIRAKRT